MALINSVHKPSFLIQIAKNTAPSSSITEVVLFYMPANCPLHCVHATRLDLLSTQVCKVQSTHIFMSLVDMKKQGFGISAPLTNMCFESCQKIHQILATVLSTAGSLSLPNHLGYVYIGEIRLHSMTFFFMAYLPCLGPPFKYYSQIVTHGENFV